MRKNGKESIYTERVEVKLRIKKVQDEENNYQIRQKGRGRRKDERGLEKGGGGRGRQFLKADERKRGQQGGKEGGKVIREKGISLGLAERQMSDLRYVN